jgi:hypothetical protein
MIEYAVKALDCLGHTVYRVVERRTTSSEWTATLPCIDWDVESDAINAMKRAMERKQILAECRFELATNFDREPWQIHQQFATKLGVDVKQLKQMLERPDR